LLILGFLKQSLIKKVIKTLSQIFFVGFILLSIQSLSSEPYHPKLANPVSEPWRWIYFPEYDTIHINCLVKEENGGMWMGIGNKAVYYDGYKTIQYIPDSTTVQSLIFENDNNLLASTSNGVFRFKDGMFKKILDFHFNGQRNFIHDRFQNCWIGSDFGLIQITTKTIFCKNQEGYFEIAHNGSILNTLKLDAANDYHHNNICELNFPVYNLTISEQQRIWMVVNTPDKNLASITLSNLQSTTAKWELIKAPTLSFGDVSAICEHNNSLYLTSTNPNIELSQYHIPTKNWESVNMKAIGGDNVQSSVIKTSDGTLWIGGHSKLYSLTQTGWKIYQYPEIALPLSFIKIAQDENNNLYLFGAGGSLMKLDRSQQNFSTYLGLNFQCNSTDGNYWFTTNTGEVVTSDSGMHQFKSYSTSDGLMNMAMTVHFSKKSGLWAAGSHQGKAAIARFQNGHWNMTLFPNLYLGIAYNGICELGDSAIAFPGSGVPDMGNANFQGGFITYNYKRGDWKSYPKGLVPQRIPNISQTPDGKLWFSGGGPNVFDGKTTQQIDFPSKSANWIDDVRVSPSGQIWVAQGGTGLFKYDSNKWTRFTTFDGLASNMVTNIYLENDSSIYVASDKGISHFDGKQFISQIIHPDLNIQRERGFMRKSVKGELWINQATREWYLYDFKNSEDPNIFKTTRYLRGNNPPKTNIAFSNQEISSTGNIIIAYDGIDYWNQTPTNKIQFSHRLNGKDWSPFSTEKSCTFLDLDAGEYTLEVRAKDQDGNIESQPASISFSVLPPVYRRAWFILTILTFIGIIGWQMTRLYTRNKQIHELDQLKLRLFTDISHELKTPLTLISLPLQKLLSKHKEPQEITENLELIHSNVQRLNNLVNQVIDFRRLEAGKIQLDLSPGDIISHLQKMANYYAPLSHEKNIKFQFTSNIHELWVNYDADKLEKIVVNLLSNAFKFTPKNETIELIIQVDSSKDQIRLLVNDSGPGIPSEMQQNIFDRFYRLRDEKHSRIPGSGIGLSLVKELVRLHQGTIEVISDGKHGSSFCVILPFIPAVKTEENVKLEENTDLHDFEVTERATILLIEDEEPMLRFVVQELTHNFEVKGVSSVEKAFEWLSTEMPDLIISDVMLPGMNGIEFCKKLKSEPLTSHLPVILLTARNSEEDIVEGLETGADDYITKPFRMNELIARCYNLIKNRQRLKERFASQEELEAGAFVQNSADQDFLDKAIRIVFENLENAEFDVSQFCLQMNTSKTLLYSKLKSLTGQSATEFVRNIRLKEAKKMLLNNVHQLTIAEISYKVGFNDPLYFSRCFRKYFGFPPSEVGK